MAQPIDTAYVDLEARTDKAVKEIQAALKKINDAIKQAAKQLREELTAAANDSADAFAKLATTADAALAHVADNAADVGDELRTEIIGGAKQAGQAISKFARDATDSFEEVADEAGDTAEDIARHTAIGAYAAERAIDKFADSAVADLLRVAAAARLLRAQLTSVSNQMRTLFSVGLITQLATQIMQVFQQFGGGIVAMLTKMGIAAGGVTVIIGGLAAAITGLVAAIGGAITAISQFVNLLIAAAGVLAILPGAFLALRIPIAVAKFALQDFADTAKTALSAETTEEFNEAIADLSKNAQNVVRVMRDLKPAVDELRLETQSRLFAGLDQSLRQIARAHLPTANRYFKELATILNGVIRQGVTFLSNEQSKLDFATIMYASAYAARNLGNALVPLLQIFRDVATVGAAVFAVLTDEFAGVAQGWADRITEMRESGELAKIMMDGVAAVKALGAALADIWGILRGIGQAAQAAGGEFGLLNFLDRLNESVNSAQGQQSLTHFFSELNRLGTALKPVLDAIVQAIGPLATGIANIAEAAGPGLTFFVEELGKALIPVLSAFEAFTVLIGPLATLLGPLSTIITQLALSALPGFDTIIRAVGQALFLVIPFASDLGNAIAQLAGAVAPFIPILAQAAAQLVLLIVPGVTAFLDGLLQGVMALAPAIGPVGVAISSVLTALAPLLPLIGQVLVSALTAAATALVAISGVLGPFIDLLAQAFVGAIITLLPPLLDLAQQALPAILTAGAELFTMFAPLIPKIIELAQAFGESLLPYLPQIAAMMEDQLLPALYELASVLSTELIALLAEIIPQVPELTAAFIELVPWIIQMAALLIPLITYGLQSASMMGDVTNVLILMRGSLQVANIALGIIVASVKWFYNVLSLANSVIIIFRDRIVAAIAWVVKVTTEIPRRLLAALGNTKSLMFGAGTDIITGLINGIKSKATAAANAALGVVTGALQSAKNWLGIRSPSRRAAAEIGKPFTEGIIGGVHSELNALRQTTGTLANTLVSGTLDSRPSGLNGATLGSVASNASAGAVGGSTITFAPGAISVSFAGAVPTEEQAYMTGQSVGAGISDALGRRDLQTTIRSI